MKYPKLTKLVFILLALGLLTNCGASKTSKQNNASRVIPDRAFDAPPQTGDAVFTNCNNIPANDIGLGGPVSSFWDPQAQAFIDDWIRMKFNDRPTALTSSATHYLEIYRWKEAGVYNQTPVEIAFQLKGSGQILQETVTVLSRASIQNIIVNNNLGNMGYTTDNFFDGVILILQGMDIQWDAITMYYYDDSVGPNPINSVDVLLPAFDANPTFYAEANPYPDLQEIHPMWQFRNSGFDDMDYYNATFALCSGF